MFVSLGEPIIIELDGSFFPDVPASSLKPHAEYTVTVRTANADISNKELDANGFGDYYVANDKKAGIYANPKGVWTYKEQE
jgi:hypothetical protein